MDRLPVRSQLVDIPVAATTGAIIGCIAKAHYTLGRKIALYSETIYRLVGGLIGYVLCPVALAGFGTPLYLHFFQSARPVFAAVFTSVAVLIALSNVYLCARRAVVGEGASLFPACFSMAAIPAWFLHEPAANTLTGAVTVILILLFDFMGQSLLGLVVAKFTNKRA